MVSGIMAEVFVIMLIGGMQCLLGAAVSFFAVLAMALLRGLKMRTGKL